MVRIARFTVTSATTTSPRHHHWRPHRHRPAELLVSVVMHVFQVSLEVVFVPQNDITFFANLRLALFVNFFDVLPQFPFVSRTAIAANETSNATYAGGVCDNGAAASATTTASTATAVTIAAKPISILQMHSIDTISGAVFADAVFSGTVPWIHLSFTSKAI